MEKTRMSTKGQIVVPKSIRQSRGWPAGMEFTILENEAGILLKPVSTVPKTNLDQLVGCIPYFGPVKSIEEMDEGIARKVKERHGRRRH